ncbi:unnamed protein product [Ectocarpus sp. CCAP 1310/34]|nr:unnamed protein product [Ectocarpus sp. CCAP 1310/34]
MYISIATSNSPADRFSSGGTAVWRRVCVPAAAATAAARRGVWQRWWASAAPAAPGAIGRLHGRCGWAAHHVDKLRPAAPSSTVGIRGTASASAVAAAASARAAAVGATPPGATEAAAATDAAAVECEEPWEEAARATEAVLVLEQPVVSSKRVDSNGVKSLFRCLAGGAARVHSPAAAVTVARPAAAVEMTVSTVSRGMRAAVAAATAAATAAMAQPGMERQRIPLTEGSCPGGGERPGVPCWEWTSHPIEVEMHGHMLGGDASHQAAPPGAAAAAQTASAKAPSPTAASSGAATAVVTWTRAPSAAAGVAVTDRAPGAAATAGRAAT